MNLIKIRNNRTTNKVIMHIDNCKVPIHPNIALFEIRVNKFTFNLKNH